MSCVLLLLVIVFTYDVVKYTKFGRNYLQVANKVEFSRKLKIEISNSNNQQYSALARRGYARARSNVRQVASCLCHSRPKGQRHGTQWHWSTTSLTRRSFRCVYFKFNLIANSEPPDHERRGQGDQTQALKLSTTKK